MKIRTTDNYFDHRDCPFRDCERFYCVEHRLLFRLCDTAYQGEEGDRDVINGTRILWFSDGECPECKRQERVKRFEREVADRAWQEVELPKEPSHV